MGSIITFYVSIEEVYDLNLSEGLIWILLLNEMKKKMIINIGTVIDSQAQLRIQLS